MFPVTDPILVFTIIMLCILVAPVFSARLRIPDLVLLLGFGALFGPNGFHVLERNTAVTLLGSIGLLYIMFLAGIEIDLHRFILNYKRSLVFGLLTFIIPQSLGTLAGRYVLGMSWPASLLMASMFASHTLLAYPLASRIGISRSEPVVITVGATIITDTLALMILAVIADSTRGIPLNPGFWATIGFGMLILTVLIWKGIPLAARWFFQRVTEENNAQFLFVIVTVCGCAYLSHFARMEPIIGAFLAGAAFNRLIPENSPLMSRVTFAGNTLFIPFFLISVGMLMDVRAMLTGPRSWLVVATMVIMVVMTKYAAAEITRRVFRYSRASGQVMFGLSVVQAAATLAAVVVGYNLNIFDEAVLNGAIAMILVTCPLGAWMVARYGRRMAAEEPPQSVSGSMEQRLLVPVANPESAIRLLDMAFMLRNTDRPGGIYPLNIALDHGNTDAAVAQGEKLLGLCMAHAASADIPVSLEMRVAVNVSDGIIHAVRELRSSMVVTGWSDKQSTSIRIFGTVMHHLTEKCPSRLLFCRLIRPLNTTGRLMVLFPPLSSRRRNLSALIRDIKMLAQRIGSELRIYAMENEAFLLEALIQKARPSCRLSSAEAGTWEKLQQSFFAEIKPDDMIVLPVDRRNGILWTPAFEYLPERITERFPEVNLLVAYPSLPVFDEETGVDDMEQDEEFPLLLPADLSPENPLEKVLRRMVEAAYPAGPDMAGKALENLLASAHSYPVELAPGIVLLHARCGDPEQTLLMICHAPDGWAMTGLPSPARIILVLLGANTRPPEEHLKTLSRVASRILKAGLTAELHSAKSAAEICSMLTGNGKRFSQPSLKTESK